MYRNRLLALLLGPIICMAISTAVSHAAVHLVSYQFRWLSNRALSLQAPDGHLVATLKAGEKVSIRNGSQVLTLSLKDVKPEPTPTATPVDGATQPLLAAINKDRLDRGVPALALDARLSACSLRHSQHMAAMGNASHDQFAQDICVHATAAAENVGAARGAASNAVMALHRSMMKEGPCSTTPCDPAEIEAHGHYLNLMNRSYTRIGIGVYTQAATTWLTEDFTN